MLNLYRRHTIECLKGSVGANGKRAGGLEDRKPKLNKKKINEWRPCKCPVWIFGTWNGATYPRTSLHINDWKTAETKLGEIMKASNAEGVSKAVTLEEALACWIKAAENDRLADRTMYQYRNFQRHCLAWAQRHHITDLQKLDSNAMRDWRSEWRTTHGAEEGETRRLAETTEYTRLRIIKGFFNFAIDEGWITRNPLAGARIPKAKPPSKEDTEPLDCELRCDDNYRAVLAAIPDALASGASRQWGRPTTELRSRPDNFAAFCVLMYEGGFRCSDALVFDPDRMLVGGEGFASYTYIQIKTQRECTTFLPPEVVAQVRALPRLSSGLPFFSGPGTWNRKEKHATRALLKQGLVVASMLRRVGDVAHVPNLHAHRFRNSFAVNGLNNGMPIEHVSARLGHTSIKTTQEYYSPWVKSRMVAQMEVYKAARQRILDPAKVVTLPRKRA